MTERLRLVLRNEAGGATLTGGLVARLHEALASAGNAALVTIEGPGDADSFCDGLDLAAAAAGPVLGDVERFAALLAAIEAAPCPVVALVGGAARGGGVGIAAAADLVIASPRATFGLPEALLGLVPAAVFPVLARRVGLPRARLLAIGGAPLDAASARRLGLADEVADDLETALARHAARFARMDRRAVAAVKALAATHFAAPPGYADAAAARFADLVASPGTRARLARFAAGDAPWEEGGA